MQLSDKGKKKILDNYYWFAEEFESNDFVNCIMLTVDEAKQANQCVMIEIANLINDFGPSELIHELEVLSEKLKKQIEQTEGQNESSN